MGKTKGKKSGGKKGYADLDDANDGGRRVNGTKASNRNGGKGGVGSKGGQTRKKKKGPKAGVQLYDDDEFRRTLMAEGHRTINEMASDGNCLFRSLSDQLYRDYGNRHDQIRSEVCDFLEKNEEDFSVFLLLDEDEEDICDFDVYVKKMREDGEWGGNVELVSAARAYERNIKVFSPTGAFSIESGAQCSDGHDLLLSYHENGHYNSIHDERLLKQAKSRGQPENDSRYNTRKGKQAKKGKGKPETPEVAKDNGDESLSEKKDNGEEKIKKEPILRRNDACPCGSGLKYKKCCLAKEKHKIRLARMKAEQGINEKDDSNGEGEEGGADDFKVVKI